MHGLIANQLYFYAVHRLGRDAWVKAVNKVGGKLSAESAPQIDRTYPDEEITGVVVALAEISDSQVAAVLGDFGAFLAPALLRVYQPLIRQEWGTLDVVEHVEEHIHTVVRLKDPTAGPPYLSARRISTDRAEVIYSSQRRLCELAVGIVKGIAEHFQENISVSQSRCMLRGDPSCLIQVSRTK